jgi:NitT/TauT family transport system ATP-binding protein
MKSEQTLSAGARNVGNDGIHVSSVSRRFAYNTLALSEVSFEVDSGAFVALLGPSGCGKTTLLRLLCGLDQATSGTITIADGTPEDARKQGLFAMAFQEPALFPWRTVAENVRLPLELNGHVSGEAVDRVLKLMRLNGAEFLMPAELSGGMAQRVAVARALVRRPRVLLLDEPLGALDWFLRREIIEELELIWNSERPTTLLVTHDSREASYLADRIMIMSKRPGTIIDQVEIPFGRPRQKSLWSSAEFHQICDQVDSLCESHYES